MTHYDKLECLHTYVKGPQTSMPENQCTKGNRFSIQLSWFFSTPLDDGLDNQWEESGWWAVGAVDHPPIQVGYWTSPISSWTLSIRIVSDINLLLYKWIKKVMSFDNFAALEWAISYDIYPPCMHCSFKLKPSSMCSILFCPSWLTQHYSTNPTHVVDPMNQRNLCKA